MSSANGPATERRARGNAAIEGSASGPGGLRRRQLLARGCAFAALPGTAFVAHAADTLGSGAPAFDAAVLKEAFAALGGIPVIDAAVIITIPDLVENGASVPVTLSSIVPGASELAIVVESNPDPLAARFAIAAGTDPFVSARIKMADSGRVFGVVVADGRLHVAVRPVQVMVGGCQ